MYLSDFNMMLDGKMIDCFSEISLDKNIINDLNEKLKENNSLYNINNNISDAEENTKSNQGNRGNQNANNQRPTTTRRTYKTSKK
jgi:hypothetical protein